MVLVAVPQLALSWARLGRHWQLQEEAEKWWRGEQEEGDSRHSHLHIVDIIDNRYYRYYLLWHLQGPRWCWSWMEVQ